MGAGKSKNNDWGPDSVRVNSRAPSHSFTRTRFTLSNDETFWDADASKARNVVHRMLDGGVAPRNPIEHQEQGAPVVQVDVATAFIKTEGSHSQGSKCSMAVNGAAQQQSSHATRTGSRTGEREAVPAIGSAGRSDCTTPQASGSTEILMLRSIYHISAQYMPHCHPLHYALYFPSTSYLPVPVLTCH